MERKLPRGAIGGVSGDHYQPLVPSGENPPEFTFRSVLIGSLLGVVFGAANAYLGLKVGITVSTSIPIAVMTVAILHLARTRGTTILEANMSQTTGSASSSLASGVIFTVPALFLWGLSPSLLELTLLSLCGGILGTLAMIPLRRPLIKKEHGHLLYPEGTACAEILVAAERGGAQARTVFNALGLGALFKMCTDVFHLWPQDFEQKIPKLPKGVFTLEAAPMFLGVGFILGYKVSAVMVAGSLLSAMVFIPLIAHFGQFITSPMFPEAVKPIAEMSAEEIWSRYIRYIGAGGVAAGGILTILRTLPTMISAFRAGLGELLGGDDVKAHGTERTDRDISFKWLIMGSLGVIAVIALVPSVLAHVESVGMRLVAAVCVAVFAFFFVTVSSRIVGFVGVSSNPTSGMTIATLIGTSAVFYLLDWTDMAGKVTALTVGTIVCTAASIAGDTSQDMKTGFLLGATPRRQQWGQLIGVLTSCAAVCGAVIVLSSQYGFGTKELPAPQATLMKTVIEGILSANLPWTLVFIGALSALIVELLGIRALPFAVGMYLPLSSMSPIFAGGLLRAWIERRHAKNEDRLETVRKRGVLFGSGLVAGQGIMGVIIAGLAFALGRRPDWGSHAWMGEAAPYIALVMFLAVGYYMMRVAQQPERAAE